MLCGASRGNGSTKGPQDRITRGYEPCPATVWFQQECRQRNRIINVTLLTVVFAVAAYIAVTFIALEYGGTAVGLPWAPPSWAFPAVGLLLVAGGPLIVIPRAFHRARKRFGG